jgi:hypothetical protein
MHSTLNPKQTDPHADPHDDVLVARIEEEFSSLAPDAMRHPSDTQTHMASDFYAGAAIPAVDTTFRAADVNNVRVPGRRPSIGRRATRAVTAFLLAGCIGVAAIASQSYGNVAKQMIGRWVPKFVLTSSPPLENTGLTEHPSPPAVQANAALAAPPQPAPPAQTAAESAAPAAAASSPDSAQLMQAMARDLASARQEIDQLKASQEQMSRDIARVSEVKASDAKSSDAKSSEVKASEVKSSEIRASQAKAYEQNPRPRISALPPRPAAAPARRPTYPPAQAVYPSPQAAALPQAAAPYGPRQPDYVQRQPEPPPQATAYPQADPELSSVPRPPMPVRTGSFATQFGQ